jgi:hypothetical protein
MENDDVSPCCAECSSTIRKHFAPATSLQLRVHVYRPLIRFSAHSATCQASALASAASARRTTLDASTLPFAFSVLPCDFD